MDICTFAERKTPAAGQFPAISWMHLLDLLGDYRGVDLREFKYVIE